MLKKIKVDDVRLGMYIDEVCGSWLDHPFWKKSFSLTTSKQLKSLRECGIQEVWIDTDKGLDVKTSALVITKEQETNQIAEVLSGVTDFAPKASSVVSRKEKLQQAATLPPKNPSVAMHEEVERARKLHKKAKAAVTHMFHEVRMGKALQTEDTLALVDDITLSLARNSNAFLSLTRLKEKDHHTYLHSLAVCALMIAVGKQFGIEGEELRSLGVAGLLHDAGMMQIPLDLLNKTSSLTTEEFDVIKAHPKLGWMILNDAPEMNEIVLDVCLHHHERTDGAGYPEGLPGEKLSLYTKICTVCDVYDTITSDRCYKKGIPPAEAIRKMAAWQPGHFDLEVFHAFVKTVGIYPVSTLLMLKSGRLAVVTDQASKSLLTPIVKVFYSTKLNAPTFPEMLDLSKAQDSIVSVENPQKWGVNLSAITGI